MTDDRASRINVVASALPPEYTPVDDQWRQVEPASARILGAGGSSIVIPALYRKRLRRAIKVYLPRPDLRETLDMKLFLASYENELVQLAALSHQNISKITDFDAIQFDGSEYPFIVTEFIDGVDLAKWAATADVKGETILKVLEDVLRGLSYLHSHQVMHCDVAQKNILIQLEPGPAAVIVDLGSSRHFPPLDAGQEEELLYLFTTPRYVIPPLHYVVSNWTQNRISRRHLRRHFPYQDLHSFGVILRDFLDDEVVSSKIRRAIGSGSVEAMEHVINRMTDGRAGPEHFQSAEEVSESLRRVGKHSLSVLGIPELALAPDKGVVIPGKAPRLHGTGRVERIMSHPLFQRFHNLPQLDLLNWVLPGATHTRFVHAAHSYDLARVAIGYLLNNWEVRLQISRKDIETTLFSALINQMGHYHFLHMFEDFIAARNTDSRVKTARLQRDDELLDDILGSNPSDLGTALGSIRDERGRTLRDIVESLNLDWSEVRRRQRRPATPLEGVLAALLAGPVDVEKLAYLRDDSTATGLQFGSGLNGTPIFEAIVIPRHDDWVREGGVNRIAIGVTEHAMSYLEYGVLTRYWNVQTAYWNRTNRAVQSMLKYQIGSLIRAGLMDFDSYVMDTLHQGPNGALRWLDKRFRYAQDDGAISETVVNPMAGLLESRRVIYQRLITISGKSTIPGRDPDHQIYSGVQARSPLEDDDVCSVVERALKEVMPGLDVRPGEILVDLPRVSRDTSKGAVLVYTDKGHSLMGELFKLSPNLQQHQHWFEQYVKRMRIFLHPRIYEEVRKSGRVDDAYNRGLDALREAFEE